MSVSYSLKNSWGKDSYGRYSASITLTSDEEVTWRMLIGTLRDLADQLEEEHKDDGDEVYQ
jgi:hypothetical protein